MELLLIHKALIDWRTTFGIVFLIVLLCVLSYTIYRTYKAVVQHNIKEAELRRAARRNIRMQEMTAMVLRNTYSFLWKRENGVFDASDAFWEHMGWDGDFSTFASIFEMEPLYIQKLKDFFSIKIPGNYKVEVYGNPKDKEPHWYELKMKVEEIDGHVVQKGITVMIDERKEREAIELETHRMLLNAKESDTFISNVNYAIRTPLNAIVGISQIYTDSEMNLTEAEVKAFAKHIDHNNTLLMKTINDMLTVTLMDNSNVGFVFEDMPMGNLANMVRRIARQEVVNARETKVVVEEGPAEAVVRIDTAQMERVLTDLIGNASKFSPNGSTVTVTWRLEDGYVVICVVDRGPGIARVYQNLIFHRFYKINPFTPGTGLGLSLARMIVEKMNGTIGVDSKEGLGSTFWVRLKNVGGTAAAGSNERKGGES